MLRIPRAVLRCIPLAALLLSTAPVRAHDVSYAHAEVRWLPARVEVTQTVHQDDAAMALGIAATGGFWFVQRLMNR
jgi:hypothetical protein